MAELIVGFFSNSDNINEIRELRQLGVEWPNLTDQLAQADKTDGDLTGNTYVITGKFEGISRDEIAARLGARGGKVTGSVSKKTTALICGEAAGSKLSKAKKLAVPIIDAAGLQALIGDLL